MNAGRAKAWSAAMTRHSCWVVAAAALAAAPAAPATSDRWTRLGDDALWAVPCRIGAETRPAAACDGPADDRIEIAVPALEADATIAVAAALRPAARDDGLRDRTRVRATIASGDGATIATVWEATLDPTRDDDAGWHDGAATLPRAPGERRTLVLEAIADGDGAPAPVAWARPVLRHAGRPPAAVPGIVIVSLDGLRADRTFDGARAHPTTPILGRIARAGIVFTRAWAPTPDAGASRRAMLTGRPPCAGTETAPTTSVAADLQAAGWTTALVADDDALARVAGFDRAWTVAPGALPEAVRLADAWLGEIGAAPFLLVVQSDLIGRPDLVPPAARARVRIDPEAEPADRERARYDASVAWADDGLGGLLGALTRRGLVGRAALVVTAAVGYELGEHGTFGMASTVHAESLHVPLVVHHPATARERQVPFPVELRDLPRTVLDLAGERPRAAAAGETLVPMMRRETPAPRIVFGYRAGSPTTTVARTARFSWILRDDRIALYDLATDPNERTDVAATRPAVAAEGWERLRELQRRCETGR